MITDYTDFTDKEGAYFSCRIHLIHKFRLFYLCAPASQRL